MVRLSWLRKDHNSLVAHDMHRPPRRNRLRPSVRILAKVCCPPRLNHSGNLDADADMIHDCALNYFGTLLATCSSDRTIKIFSVPAASSSAPSSGSAGAGAGHSGAGGTGTGQELLDTLRGHEGPVWQVAWAHPKFGNILASCSYDGKVFVWRQAAQGWERIKEHTLHNASGALECRPNQNLGG